MPRGLCYVDIFSASDLFEPPEEGRCVEVPQKHEILADCTTTIARCMHRAQMVRMRTICIETQFRICIQTQFRRRKNIDYQSQDLRYLSVKTFRFFSDQQSGAKLR